jgi:hypothetical protein
MLRSLLDRPVSLFTSNSVELIDMVLICVYPLELHLSVSPVDITVDIACLQIVRLQHEGVEFGEIEMLWRTNLQQQVCTASSIGILSIERTSLFPNSNLIKDVKAKFGKVLLLQQTRMI